MSRIRIAGCLGIILLALVYLSVAPHGNIDSSATVEEREQSSQFIKGSEGVFSIEGIDASVEDVIRLVEDISGKRFKETPKIEIVDREELEAHLVRDFLAQYTYLMQNRKPVEIQEAAEEQARLTAPAFLGKYAFSDKVLYLIPDNILAVVKAKKLSEEYMDSFMLIALIHELTHALQDQEVDFDDKIRGIKGNEGMEAFNAMIEGHALFIQELAATQLKIENAILEESRRLLYGKVESEEPFLKIVQDMNAVHMEKVYVEGKRFIEYHQAKGGNERVWQVLDAPPADTDMIFKPETYAPIRRGKLNYTKILNGLEKCFVENGGIAEHVEIPKTYLEASYSALDPEIRKEILSKISHAHSLTIRKEDEQYGNLTIFLLDDDTYGPKFISIVEKIARDNSERLKDSAMYRMDDLAIEDFSAVKADAARKLSFTLRPANRRVVKTAIVRICNKDVVFEIVDTNIFLTDAQFVKIYETAYNRLLEERMSMGKVKS